MSIHLPLDDYGPLPQDTTLLGEPPSTPKITSLRRSGTFRVFLPWPVIRGVGVGAEEEKVQTSQLTWVDVGRLNIRSVGSNVPCLVPPTPPLLPRCVGTTLLLPGAPSLNSSYRTGSSTLWPFHGLYCFCTSSSEEPFCLKSGTLSLWSFR